MVRLQYTYSESFLVTHCVTHTVWLTLPVFSVHLLFEDIISCWSHCGSVTAFFSMQSLYVDSHKRVIQLVKIAENIPTRHLKRKKFVLIICWASGLGKHFPYIDCSRVYRIILVTIITCGFLVLFFMEICHLAQCIFIWKLS